MAQLRLFKAGKDDGMSPVNVAQVKQLSPFRYPGGKTWFVPMFRQWIKSQPRKPEVLIEPFAGGGILSCTAAFERLTDRVVMLEKDEQVAAVWRTIFEGDWQQLVDSILSFQMSLEAATEELAQKPETVERRAFQTIIKNRTYHGGILAAGSGFLKHGEAGKGILSRWYPETLAKRISILATLRDRVTVIEGDGIEYIRQTAGNQRAVYFIDPPYTASKKSAGKRLYTHFNVDHEGLFDALQATQGQFLMTYDDAPEVEDMAIRRRLDMALVPMKGTHHNIMKELVISRSMRWLRNSGMPYNTPVALQPERMEIEVVEVAEEEPAQATG